MTDCSCYAHLPDYEALVCALVKRAGERAVTYADLDLMIGWAAGYTGKVFGPSRGKRLTWESALEVLPALGLGIALVVDKEAEKRFADRGLKRQANHARPNNHARLPGKRVLARVFRAIGKAGAAAVNSKMTLQERSERGRKGAAALNAKLTKRQRKAAARKAIKARWHKPEVVEVKPSGAPPAAAAISQSSAELPRRRHSAGTGATKRQAQPR